jgi:branched-chain amino acid transport system substrate-binding protein
MKWFHTCLLAAAVTWTAGTARAQILIGQTVGLTGPVAATVKEAVDGAKLYIDSVNAKGGIRGEKIELVTLDDKFDPKIAAANANTLITEKNVVALFLNRGTPHTEAIMPLAGQARHRLGRPVDRCDAAAQSGKPVHLQCALQLSA